MTNDESNAGTPQLEGFSRGDFLLFSGVFVVMVVVMVVYAIDAGLPHGPLPLLAALWVFVLYESPIIDRYKEALRN